MSTVRLRRLTADSVKLQEYVRRHPRVRLIQMDGNPPERYQFEYRIKSLRMVGSELQTVLSHLVEVALPLNYPRLPPQCRMLSPVFHPNIAPHAICVGDHWGAGESLESIVVRIGEMLAFQSYNVKSPLNGEAARWVEQNKDQLPLDSVSLLPEEYEEEAAAIAPAAVAVSPPAVTIPPAAVNSQPVEQQRAGQSAEPQSATIAPPSPDKLPPPPIVTQCPGCGTHYRVSADWSGRKVTCKKCESSFECVPIVTASL